MRIGTLITDAWVFILHLVHHVAIYLYTVSQKRANFVKLQFRGWTNFGKQHQHTFQNDTLIQHMNAIAVGIYRCRGTASCQC